MAYNAGFEKGCIKTLATRHPDLADDLLEINDRIVDLLPIVRDHVYHPGFYGSFSIKDVLPALCPHLSYENFAVSGGSTASVLLERITTRPQEIPEDKRSQIIADLREYCRMDTWAMVELLRSMQRLATGKRRAG